MTLLLEVQGLAVAYDDLEVVHKVDLSVDAGEIVALLGSNGAGKTTTMQAIAGLLKLKRGSVKIDGADTKSRRADEIVGLGLRLVPEGRRIFGPLSVEENLQLGGYTLKKPRLISAKVDEIYDLFPRLRDRRKQLAGTLSGGEQQMLAVGRAMMTTPRILALDEPSLGLSPIMSKLIFEAVGELARSGTAVLLVEQNVREALRLADRAYVLELGDIALSGPASALADDPRIAATYLGGTTDEDAIADVSDRD